MANQTHAKDNGIISCTTRNKIMHLQCSLLPFQMFFLSHVVLLVTINTKTADRRCQQWVEIIRRRRRKGWWKGASSREKDHGWFSGPPKTAVSSPDTGFLPTGRGWRTVKGRETGEMLLGKSFLGFGLLETINSQRTLTPLIYWKQFVKKLVGMLKKMGRFIRRCVLIFINLFF